MRDSDGNYAYAVSAVSGFTAVGAPPCELMTVGKFANLKTGLVLRKGDPFKQQLDDAITELKLNGIFEEISKKWFEGPCHRATTSGAGPAAAGLFDSIVLAFLLSAFY